MTQLSIEISYGQIFLFKKCSEWFYVWLHRSRCGLFRESCGICTVAVVTWGICEYTR